LLLVFFRWNWSLSDTLPKEMVLDKLQCSPGPNFLLSHFVCPSLEDLCNQMR
jgi:hypothetical protein